MAKIKMTREGMAGYLIFFGVLMLFSEEKWIGALCLGIGILSIIIMVKFPNSRNH